MRRNPTSPVAAPADSQSRTCSACRRSSCRPASTTSSTNRSSVERGQEELHRQGRHGGVEGAASVAVQHRVLGRSRRRTVMLKVASAYEAATHHRKPPAAFPALPASSETRTSRAELRWGRRRRGSRQRMGESAQPRAAARGARGCSDPERAQLGARLRRTAPPGLSPRPRACRAASTDLSRETAPRACGQADFSHACGTPSRA